MAPVTRIAPQILSLLTTYRCTSACPNCCFNCSPKPEHASVMTLDEIKEYIHRTAQAFPSIKGVVFSGGECTLLGSFLFDAIKYAHDLGLSTRIVTNGHWATNIKVAQDMIDSLVCAGLDEINYSTGDEHSRFVNVDKMAVAIAVAAREAKFRYVVVNIEKHKDQITKPESFSTVPVIMNLTDEEKKKIVYLNSPWIEFRQKQVRPVEQADTSSLVFNNKIGCTNTCR